MGRVYRVGSHYGTEYFNTAREADRCKPGQEQPESVDCFDAAEECNRLLKDCDDAEKTINSLRMLLEDLVNVCPGDVFDTTSGQRARKFCEDNPLPPAPGCRSGDDCYGH